MIAINKICTQRRSEDQNLKTQVRFGNRDLEILTKMKGSKEPFSKVALKDFVGDMESPEFDEKIKKLSGRTIRIGDQNEG